VAHHKKLKITPFTTSSPNPLPIIMMSQQNRDSSEKTIVFLSMSQCSSVRHQSSRCRLCSAGKGSTKCRRYDWSPNDLMGRYMDHMCIGQPSTPNHSSPTRRVELWRSLDSIIVKYRSWLLSCCCASSSIWPGNTSFSSCFKPCLTTMQHSAHCSVNLSCNLSVWKSCFS
jgi:hypothetical protein